jgi:RNA ligase
MNYTFPAIEHISQALEAIKGRDEFIVKEAENFTIINYIVQMEETFPPVTDESTAILRECRGLTFNTDGRVISRPFHKFFNINERDETRLNASALTGWRFMEKLDGSMIRPISIGQRGKYRLGTKMGVTEVALNAEVFVAEHPIYDEFIRWAIGTGYTPIFEWCSNKNRIVVSHPVDRLVLTAVRNNVTGAYLPYAHVPGIECVKEMPFDRLDVAVKFMNEVKDFEGYVIRGHDGHMVKLKSEWYLQLHKTKDAIRFEKDVVRIFCDSTFDDLKPLLLEDDLKRLTEFHRRFDMEVELTTTRIKEVIDRGIKMYNNRRDFAVNYANKKDAWIRRFLFAFFNEHGTEAPRGMVLQMIIDEIVKGTSSSTALENVRHLFNCKLDDVDV